MSNLEPFRPSVFISYRARDPDLGIATALRGGLEKNEVRVIPWRDKEDIALGSDNSMEIEKGIAASDFFLQLLSEESLGSIWCRRERNHALALGKTIIPILLENVPRPIEINELQYQNMSQGVDKGLPALLKRLGVSLTNQTANPDPLNRDDRRIRRLARQCHFFDNNGSLTPWQVITVVTKPLAEAVMETGRALEVVQAVENMFQAGELRTARDIGDALLRLWEKPATA